MMMNRVMSLSVGLVMAAASAVAQGSFDEDVLHTSSGDLKITFIGHGTLMFTFEDLIVHVDPWSRVADYANLPKADVILVTHDHGDHLDTAAINLIKKDETQIVLTEVCAERLHAGLVMRNGESRTLAGLDVEAVPAYNVVNLRSNGMPYHPKGVGNGYVMTFGDTRVYVAGDTENTPEMKELRDIDVAFLPMNLPYTMTPEMVADAARGFRPRILYPYHYGDTDVSTLVDLLADTPEIEVRIRDLS
jgi:L-ascorbate metabolism protein UlaG (beta-lactamase superfamily)